MNQQVINRLLTTNRELPTHASGRKQYVPRIFGIFIMGQRDAYLTKAVTRTSVYDRDFPTWRCVLAEGVAPGYSDSALQALHGGSSISAFHDGAPTHQGVCDTPPKCTSQQKNRAAPFQERLCSNQENKLLSSDDQLPRV